jgi:hypothetical protein
VRKISSCREWTCPRCGGLLGKTILGSPFAQPGGSADAIVGTASCPCGAEYRQSDVYAGAYDLQPAKRSESAPGTPCHVCGTLAYKSSAFDMSTPATRDAAVKAGLGFQCQNSKCRAVYCYSCTIKGPTHPGTGGKACHKCGGSMDNFD